MCIGCFAALILTSVVAHAQRSSELSADLPDSRTMAVQEKVETLFVAGNFDRAFFIYRNELAPLGDKYAQYMVGYMYLTGMSVDEDSVAASAWYRLASERGTLEFMAARDQLLREMDENERRLSDVQYVELRRAYCDLAVLLASVKRNLRELEARTGSRIRSDNSVMTIVDFRGGRTRSGSDYYGSIQAQLEDRLELLIEIGEFQDMNSDSSTVNIRDLERRVKERIELFD